MWNYYRKNDNIKYPKDLENALDNLYKLYKKLNDAINDYSYIQAIEKEILNDPTFMKEVEDIVINSDNIINALLTNENFIKKITDLVITDLENNPDFINNLEATISKNLQGNQEFIKAIELVITSDQTFINNLIDLLSKNSTLITALVNALSTNQDLIDKLEAAIEADAKFISSLVTQLSTNQDLISGLSTSLTGNADFLNKLKDLLAKDTGFINSLVTLLSTNETLLNNLATSLGANQTLINTLATAISKDQTFLTTIANTTSTSLVNNTAFIQSVADKLADAGTVTKDYVDQQDAATLKSAKDYSDSKWVDRNKNGELWIGDSYNSIALESISNKSGFIRINPSGAKGGGFIFFSRGGTINGLATNLIKSSVDATNKDYVDQFSAFKGANALSKLDENGDTTILATNNFKFTDTNPLSMETQEIINLKDPSGDTSATNKKYVDTSTNGINTKIGDLSTLKTAAKDTLVNAINENQTNISTNTNGISTINTNVGDVNSLTTTAKTIVPAINENKASIGTNTTAIGTKMNAFAATFMEQVEPQATLVSNFDIGGSFAVSSNKNYIFVSGLTKLGVSKYIKFDDIGDPATLTTTSKSLVGAINELKKAIDNINTKIGDINSVPDVNK